MTDMLHYIIIRFSDGYHALTMTLCEFNIVYDKAGLETCTVRLLEVR